LAGQNTLTDAEERRAVAELIEPDRSAARLHDGLRLVPKGEAARWMSENTNPAKMLHRGRSTHGFMWRTEYKAGLLVVTDETSGLIPWVRVWELANDGPPEQMEMAL
ncbi:MAG: hypothetical protein KGR26_16495, partial [Cyanobacteria bacterium REEB65]|nr:hypothetical protein [Cyanobacteria bacterium REEB65]